VSDAQARIDELRSRIAANDRAIVLSVNERLRLVAELWQVKEELGTELLDPDRERRLRGLLAEANDGPLSPEGLDALVTELLALTKRELEP
jgi:chorismate mutase